MSKDDFPSGCIVLIYSPNKTPHNSLQNKRLFLQPNMISIFQQTINSWIVYLMKEFPNLSIKPEYE